MAAVTKSQDEPVVDEEAVEMCRTVLEALLSGDARGFCGVVQVDGGFAKFASRSIVSIKGDDAINALGELMEKIQ